MIKQLLALTFIILIFTSCKKDNENISKRTEMALNSQKETVLLTIRNIQQYDPTILYIVADMSGNILTTQLQQPNETSLILKTTKQFTGAQINLFRILIFNNDFSYLFATVGLDVNSDYHLLAYRNEESPRAKPLNIRFKNIPTFEKITASTDLSANQVSNLQDTSFFYQLSFNRSMKSDLFVKLRQRNNTYYRLFNLKDKEAKNTDVDLSSVNIKAATHKVKIPDVLEHVSADLSGKLNSNPEWYNLGATYSPNNKLEIAVPNNCFSSYNCSITASMPIDNLNGYWGYNNFFLSLPNKFEPLDLKINALQYNAIKFKINYTGEADRYQAYFYNLKQGSKSFNFCAVESKSKIDELIWPNFANAFHRPELKMDDLTFIQVVFTKFDVEAYYPPFITGKPEPRIAYKSAYFTPSAQTYSPSSVSTILKQKIKEATINGSMFSFDRNGSYLPIITR